MSSYWLPTTCLDLIPAGGAVIMLAADLYQRNIFPALARPLTTTAETGNPLILIPDFLVTRASEVLIAFTPL